MRQLIVVFVFSIVACTANIFKTKDYQASNPPILLDVLRQRYLALEDALWHVLTSDLDKSYVLQQIHSGHRTFLHDNFLETHSYLSVFDPEQRAISEAIQTINESVAITVDRYLHSSRRLFNERDSLAISVQNRNLTYHLDRIYEITGISDFYKTIQNKAELTQCDTINVQLIRSANQLIYEYYHDITAAELKAYALVQLAYMFYTVYGRGNFRGSAQALRAKYIDRTHHVQQRVKRLLEASKKDTWKCDPNRYSTGTYEEVTNFLQGYIDNEVNLNKENDCKLTCADYKVAENQVCFNGTYCAQQPEGPERVRSVCKGKIVNCEFIGSDLNVCKSENTNRRYDVIHYDNGNIFSKYGMDAYRSCESTSIRVESWTRWFVQCSNCFCLCDDRLHSERHFSLRDVVSNVNKNFVVTAVALKKFQGIFHLSIVERELKPYALVNATNPTWASYKTSAYFGIHDSLVREGLDYHTLSWENRSINLDDVEVPTGKLVTGIRFRVIDGAITLQVRATEFDFKTGQLKNIDNSFWYVSNNKNRVEIILEDPDVPTASKEKSIPIISPNRFIKFGPSSRYKDVSQTTVPFIDSQLVESHNPTPLSGVGLYYKGLPGFGGFIAPKIFNYNMGPHIIEPTTDV